MKEELIKAIEENRLGEFVIEQYNNMSIKSEQCGGEGMKKNERFGIRCVPCEYRDMLREKLKKKYLGENIKWITELFCGKHSDRVIQVCIDRKVRVYTHHIDIVTGFWVGVYYIFNKTDGKLVDIEVI